MATSEKTVREALGGYIAETLTKARVTSSLGCALIAIEGTETAEETVIENSIIDSDGEIITPIFSDEGTGDYSLTFSGLKTGTKLKVTSAVGQTNVVVATEGATNLITVKTYALSDGTAEDGDSTISIKQMTIPEPE